jgi:ribosomal protein S18 acetylase RimI-like enzyme
MNSVHFTSGMGEDTVVITRVAEKQWHAVGDDRVVGRGDASRRPDGRIFLSIDAWHGAVFDQLADAMLADLPKPEMPAEVLHRPDGATLLDPSKYAVAAQSDQYVGLVRVVQVARHPRIGLIAVRADLRRRGIARALLAQVLGSLHRCGIETAAAEVNESNGAAMALFEGVGARRASSNLELVLR